MADVRYSLVYETTWLQDVCRIEPHPLKWEALFGAIEDYLERTPEDVAGRSRVGDRIMRTKDYGFRDMPAMYVYFRILRLADPSPKMVPPGGKLSMRHVVTEADVREGLFYDYSPALAEECLRLRAALLREEG